MIPALGSNALFNNYALMQYDLVQNRLQFIKEDGGVYGIPCQFIGNVNRASQLKGDVMEAEAEMQLLPDTQLHPEEAALRGHINDGVAVGGRTIQSIEAELLAGEAAGAPQQEL